MDANAASLAALRRQIDAVDDAFGALLARRFALTDQVGRLKADVGESALDAERQRTRQAVIAAIAERHQLPRALFEDLHARLRSEVVARHRAAGCD